MSELQERQAQPEDIAHQRRAALDDALREYFVQKQRKEEVEAMLDELKTGIQTLLYELEEDKVETACGTAQIVKGRETVTWDRKGLDDLVLGNPALAPLLAHLRKVSVGADSVRITAAKQEATP